VEVEVEVEVEDLVMMAEEVVVVGES
jgi:hypothetical protein